MNDQNNRRFFVGLDLGCAQDFTAIAVLDRPRVGSDSRPDQRQPVYSLRHLQRFHLGTPYTQIVPAVVKMLQSPQLKGCTLVVDMTGVGRPVVDMLDQAMRDKVDCKRIAVSITGGNAARLGENGCLSVPKKELIANLQVLLQTRRLHIARSLPAAETLVKEMENYRVKISTAGNEQFGEWRSGHNDDLLLACALSAFVAEKSIPSLPRTQSRSPLRRITTR